jgi:hypothetical protein
MNIKNNVRKNVKHNILGLFFIVSLVLGITGCSIFGNQSEAPTANKPTLTTNAQGGLIAPRAPEDISPRKRVMVLPFLDTKEGRPAALREQSREEFIRDLNIRGGVIALNSADLKMDLSKFVAGNEYKMDEITKAASSMGIVAILEGRIEDLKVKRQAEEVGLFRQMKTRFEASVRVRIFGARSGKELFNTLKTVTLDDAQTRVAENANADRLLESNPVLMQKLVSDAFLDFTDDINSTIDKLGWEGRVAMISADRIFLNVGRISGVQMGDILKVSDEGEDVYDPQTGRYVGRVPGRLKGTLEVVSFFGQDGAIAIIHSGAGFKENDRVELY